MRQLMWVVQKKSLPFKRRGYTQKAIIDGQTVFVRTGEKKMALCMRNICGYAQRRRNLQLADELFYIAGFVGLQ